jgi:phenylacetate-CoA ligase
MHQTSGTTGVPLKVLDTTESWDWWGRCWGHVLAGAGVTASDRLFMAFAFGPFIGFWAAVEGARKIGAVMIPGGGRDSQQRLELMRDVGATVLCCTPTYALRLAEVATELGFDLTNIPMKATVHAGEPGASIPVHQAAHRGPRGPRSALTTPAPRKSVPIPSNASTSRAAPTLIESEYIAEVINPQTGGRRRHPANAASWC